MSAPLKKPRSAIYTIGHSTRPIDKFVNLLLAHGIKKLVDIRTVPKSRHNPQFNAEKLKSSLHEAGIDYGYADHLTGFRKTKKDSTNLGWKNLSFRGFADYMQTPEFNGGLEELEKEAFVNKIAIMCAEAVPWRCHRSLVADALTHDGWEVRHIQSSKVAARHEKTPFMRVRNGKIIYPQPK